MIYSRNSSAKQKSIDDQQAANRAATELNGWTVVAELDDPSSASRYATKVRRNWARLLELLPTIDVVVLWEPSRGDRTLATWVGFLDACREHCVRIHAVTHNRFRSFANGLSHNADGNWLFTRRQRDTFVFNTAGQLIAERDRNGYATNLSYDGSGRLTTVTEPAGRTLTLGYTAGQLASVTDPAGHSVSYGYDSAGQLTSVTDVTGGVTTYGYDASHRLTTLRRGHHVLTRGPACARRRREQHCHRC